MALLSYPSVGTSQSISSASSAWSFGAYKFLFATDSNTKTIIGITFQTTYVPADDTTIEQLFEIGFGPTGSEVVKVQIPYSMRDDTGADYYIQAPESFIMLPEPITVPANTKVSIRVTDSIASALDYIVKVRVDGTRNLIESLSDNFNDNSVDNKWFMTTASAARYSETSSRLQCTTLTTSGYYDFQSRESYNVTGSAISIQLVDPGTFLTSLERYPIYLTDASGGNGLFWLLYVGGGTGSLRCYKRVGGVQTQVGTTLVSYSVNTHKYFRIRESAGTTYWDWSTDGISWTNHFSNANYIDMTDLYFKIETGNYAAEASGTTVIYDNLNIPVTSVSTIDGLARASISTYNGLALSSVSTVNGLA